MEERALSPRARVFLEKLADLEDGRSIRDRAAAAGLSEGYAYRLTKRPAFIAALRDRVRAVVRYHLPAVYAKLVEEAKAGNVNAARVLLQAVGDLSGDGVAVTVTTSTTNLGMPERLTKLLDERRAMLRDFARDHPGMLPAVESIGGGNVGDAEAVAEDTQSVGNDAGNAGASHE